MTVISKRVKERREALNLSQSELARRVGEKPQTIQKLEAGIVRRPRYIIELAKALSVSVDWLTGSENFTKIENIDADQAKAVESPQPPVILPALDEMPRDVPVLGTAKGGLSGSFLLNEGDPIDWVRRPPGIMKARNVYSLYVEGTSMAPRFAEGELVYAHPGRKVKVGDYVIVQQAQGDHKPNVAFIKKLKRRTASKIVLEQSNPKATIEMPVKTVESIHLILTMNDLFGV
ncbi:MAG: helix-turn-helix transcriptional regulator [Rhodospirillales bacterium]|nr:helix-turn-helix transcriptional regulator [Rhodospirillales bacterium]